MDALRCSSSLTVCVTACWILSLLAAKSTPASSGGLRGRLSRLFRGIPESGPGNRSTARAREAVVEAFETGGRGLELLSGGDFLGIGAEM